MSPSDERDQQDDRLARDSPRGDGLADAAGAADGARETGPPAAGGPRGDGLATDAEPARDAAPGQLAENSPRGDGLAGDA